MSGLQTCPLTRRSFLAAAGLSVAAAHIPTVAAADGAPLPRHTVVQDQGGAQTYLLVFDKGQEIMGSLLAFAKKERLTACGLTGIGAVSDAALAYFDRKAREYKRNPVPGQAAVASLACHRAYLAALGSDPAEVLVPAARETGQQVGVGAAVSVEVVWFGRPPA